MSDEGVPCTGCGAPVIWTITEKNRKRMPVDAKPQKRVVFLRDPKDPATPISRVVSTFTPHWASCPMAERFRKSAPPPPVRESDGDNDPDGMLADGDPGEL